jgi:Tfp pilus assembly protein PilV
LLRVGAVGFLFFFVGCGPLQCQTAQQANWQDKSATVYKYKTTIRCTKTDGTTEDLTLVSSKTPITRPGGEK